MRLNPMLWCATCLTLVTPIAPAFSADLAANNDAEIIVTARKRQETILQTPVVETVLTKQVLEQRQIRTISDITTLTPGLLIGDNTSDVGTQVSIRGIGTNVQEPGIDQSVSLNVDGLVLTQGTAFRSAFFDMQQVEVLKGPQALFYGKSSPGGVISIHTADPGDKFEIIGRSAHEFVGNSTRGDLILSGPVTDTLGLRVASTYTGFDSYFHNLAPDADKNWGDGHSLFVRGTAVFKPTSDFSAKLKVNYGRDFKHSGQPNQLVGCPDGTANYTPFNFIAPNENCKLDRNVYDSEGTLAEFPAARNNAKDYTETIQKFGTLDLEYNPTAALSLSSLTSYYKAHINGPFSAGDNGTADPSLIADKDYSRRDFEQELRLNSDYAGPINFTLGGFYQKSKALDKLATYGNQVDKLPLYLTRRSHDLHIDSKSAFGQVRYKPFEKLELAGGVRYTDEKRTDFITTINPDNSVVHPPENPLHAKNWSPEFTITYHPNENTTLFAAYKQAYKSGSFSFTTVAVGQDNSFGDEKTRGGEGGLKIRAFDNQVYASVAGYYYKYSGLQTGANVSVPGQLPFFKTTNAASAKTYGVDFEMTYRPIPIPDLSLRAAVNWNKARYIDFKNAPCYGGQTAAEGCDLTLSPATGLFTTQDLSGAPLVRAPEWQVNLGGTYDVPVGRNMTLELGADGQYTSRYLNIIGRRPDFYQPRFAKIDANVALKGPNDAWELALMVNNLTNKYTTGNCVNSNVAGGAIFAGEITGAAPPAATRGAAGEDETTCAADLGRTVWLQITLRPLALFGR